MNPKIVNDLNEIALEIKARIQAYADLHNISFEEAQKRAKLKIGGVEIKPFEYVKTKEVEEE